MVIDPHGCLGIGWLCNSPWGNLFDDLVAWQVGQVRQNLSTSRLIFGYQYSLQM
jgi:hypothetical protein